MTMLTTYQREIADALEWVAAVLVGPVPEPYPTLTPEVWRSMRCRDGHRCRCAICGWEARFSPRVVEWRRQQALRPRLRSDLPSLDHVLVSWAERTFSRSPAGALLARGRDEAPPTERSREPWAIRRAEVAMEVERAIDWAYSTERSRFGLDRSDCEHALLLSVRGEALPGVEPDLLSRVVRAGRRAVLIDLAARGLVRLPKGRRDRIAVEDRVREIYGEAPAA